MANVARNPDVERRINEHLEAIDRALVARGVPLTERRSVTGDVEAQVREMLAEKAGDTPTVADVEAVLQKLDAPESYAEDTEVAIGEKLPVAAATEPARFSRTAILGAAWGPFLFVLLFALFTVREVHVLQPGAAPPGPSSAQIAAKFTLIPLGLFAPFGCTILGWLAVSRIRRSNGRLCGLGLALIDGLFFPLLLLDILFYFMWRLAVAMVITWNSYSLAAALRNPEYPSVDNNPMLILVLTAVTALVVDWLAIRWAWRKVKTPIQE